jgi:hypothetical protein
MGVASRLELELELSIATWRKDGRREDGCVAPPGGGRVTVLM